METAKEKSAFENTCQDPGQGLRVPPRDRARGLGSTRLLKPRTAQDTQDAERWAWPEEEALRWASRGGAGGQTRLPGPGDSSALFLLGPGLMGDMQMSPGHHGRWPFISVWRRRAQLRLSPGLLGAEGGW
jgi:hypothetical protein